MFIFHYVANNGLLMHMLLKVDLEVFKNQIIS